MQRAIKTSATRAGSIGGSRNRYRGICGDIFATASADEYRHAQMLAALLSCPTPYLAEDETLSAAAICPGDLHKAISGELDAICEYAGLAAIAPSAEARSVLMSILGDEYGHARLFMLLQETGLCCTW